MLSECACPYAVGSKTVTTTTGGVPDGCRCDGREPEKSFDASQSVPMTMRPMMDIVLTRLRRRCGSLEGRDRKGGGFELFRDGYAKCIVSSRSDGNRVWNWSV